MSPTRQHPSKRRELVFAGGGLALVAALGWLAWDRLHQPGTQPAQVEPPAATVTAESQDGMPPAESFKTLCHIRQDGGDRYSQAAANMWLDSSSRDQRELTADQESFLLTMLRDGGHPSWKDGYRQQLFNSACNVLHLGKQQEAYARVLQQMASAHEDLTLRLYALQHIALMRQNSRLTGDLGEQIYASVKSLALKPGEPVAGSAIWVLATWNGEDQILEPEVLNLALEAAANPNFSIDIRVTALHAAGAQCLPLARKLAVDASAPLLLRKASIARIGQHGDANDLVGLNHLRTENFRLAQAAEPALTTLRVRLSGSPPPAPIRF